MNLKLKLATGLAASLAAVAIPVAAASAAAQPDQPGSRSHQFVWGICKVTAGQQDVRTARVVQNSATGTCHLLGVQGCATDGSCGPYSATDKPLAFSVRTSAVSSGKTLRLAKVYLTDGSQVHMGIWYTTGAYVNPKTVAVPTAVQPADQANRGAYLKTGACAATVVDNTATRTATLTQQTATNTCRYIQVQAFGWSSCGCLVAGYADHRSWAAAFTQIHSTLPSGISISFSIATLDDGVYGVKKWKVFPSGYYYRL